MPVIFLVCRKGQNSLLHALIWTNSGVQSYITQTFKKCFFSRERWCSSQHEGRCPALSPVHR
jgi:hypothetical protein